MKTLIASAALGVLSVFAIGMHSPGPNGRSLVSVSESEFRAHMDEIRQHEFDVAGVDHRRKLVYLVTTASERSALRSLGLQVEERLGARSLDQGPDPKYKTPDQMAAAIRQLAADHPDLATAFSIGKSLEGREIMAIKITKNAGNAVVARKPAILFNGMHHAREVMSSEVPLDIATQLLTRYGSDASITRWVDSFEIYVLPMLNVDGNNKVWTEDSMWRKNVRGGYGVDINRNYPYAWSTCAGASDSQSAEDYRGPSPASEPETNALMNFVSSIHPVFDISFHSFSELVIYPYGCGNHVETKDIVEPLGQKMASIIPSDDDSGTYTAGVAPDLLYGVDGDDIDWMYHEVGTIPYVIELNSSAQGFQPSYDDWREKTVTKLRPAWQLLLSRMEGASVRGRITGVSAATRIEVRGTNGFTENAKPASDGGFDLILNSGEYDINVVSGDKKSSQHVRVDSTPVPMDVTL